jgi:hypothetical protein
MILAIICLFITHSTQSELTRWHSIVPLRTTRQQVERLLGPPNRGPCACGYSTPQGNVSVVYSQGDCVSCGSGGWDIPVDTVIRFTVYPLKDLRLSDLNVNQAEFEKRKDIHIEGGFYYYNEENGIGIETYEDTVSSFVFSSKTSDKKLRCGSTSRD